MGVFSNKIQRDTLKPGDHIYTWRNAYLYSHHGIYAGEGKVIHFTRAPGQEIGTGTFLDKVIFSSSGSTDRAKSPCPECGDQSNLSGVISSCLDCFLWDGELYLFEYKVSPAFFLAKARGGTCTLAPSDPSEDVLSRASFLLENGFGGYNIFKNNCEDFAIYCKTGLLVITDISVGRSGQATSFVAAVSAIVSSPLRFLTTSCSGLAVVGCGMYCVSRLVSDIGVRRDVMKVPVKKLVSRCEETGTPTLGLISSCELDQPTEIKAASSCELDQVAERPETETPILGLVSCCDLDQQAVTETDKLLVVSSCDLDQTAEIKAASSCELDQVAERPETETPILGLVSCCDLDQPAVTETAKLLVVSSCNVGQQDEIEKANLGLDGSCEVGQPGEAATANAGPVSSCDLDKQVDTPTPTPTVKQDSWLSWLKP